MTWQKLDFIKELISCSLALFWIIDCIPVDRFNPSTWLKSVFNLAQRLVAQLLLSLLQRKSTKLAESVNSTAGK